MAPLGHHSVPRNQEHQSECSVSFSHVASQFFEI